MTGGGGPTVLVVDDDEAVADVYASHLSTSYRVLTAYDGESALELVDDEVDVVLLDRRMHGMSGYEVLERIRERGHACGVVMVTAVDPRFDIVDVELDDYLRKPVEGEELEAVVADVAGRLDEREVNREYLALAAKVATLRVQKSEAELAASDEYGELVDRLTRLESRADVDADVDVPVDR